ncbi:hypothetical protein CEV08_02880 [Bartonella tribocorum]|uniref:Chromosome segregation ATPase n=1 Tax=Bartonella tribocorum TaxID=85701 RepID=A0A2M6UWY4_9HYPH|nr:hypothetical protein CEV08_02880 [Bartonella tribocorum]
MLIQSFLFFILGVASTSWLLVLLSPLIWRKAVHFAQKNIYSQIPLSLTEIQANHDFVRAKHAVELAKNQQKYESLQKKYAQQKIHLSQLTEQLYRLYLPTQDISLKEAIAIKQNIPTTNIFKEEHNDT